MKSLVGEWISNLAIIAVLAALVDMILPNGSFRKYTGFIFGLVILVMFIQPLLQITDQAMHFDNSVFRNLVTQNTETAVFQSNQTAKDQKEKIEQMLKETLEKDLAMDLKYNAGVRDAEVKIYFGKQNGETNLSDIQRIEVNAAFKEQPLIIDTIVVNAGNETEQKNTRSEYEDKISEIKEYVSGLLDIHESKIYINNK